MKKNRNNKKHKFWRNYRIDAAEHFNIATRTVDDWYKRSDPKLINWLWEEQKRRKAEKEEAENRKKLFDAEATNGN